MLPAYYNHFRAFENALVTKFYGLHCVKLNGPSQKKVYLYVVEIFYCLKKFKHLLVSIPIEKHGFLIRENYEMHIYKIYGFQVRFIIMGNLFCSEYTIHRRFDLKGSSLGRITTKPESEITETTILKDLDLNFIFRLQRSWFLEFCR